MASTASPYGLRPVNMLGGAYNTGGAIRQIPMTVNHATAIYTGDIIMISAASAGQPSAATATVTTTTQGVLGVCVGVSYVDPTLKYQLFAQSLPGGAVTAGYTNVMIHVNDDPNQLYMVQGSAAIAATVRGKFAAITGHGGNALTGLSSTKLDTPANTATLAVRIVDFVDAGAAFTDCIVKFNAGVLMWNTTTVLAN